MIEPVIFTTLKNIKGIPLIDGTYLDKSLYLTSSQFFYDSGIIPKNTRRIKYMWIIVSTIFNLVSRDIDIKFFNSFKTIIEMDTGICKYLYQYKNAFMLVQSKILRLQFADLFFKVKECMFISKSNLTLLSLKHEINEKKRTKKVLDTLPTLFTIVKLTFYQLFHFIKNTIISGTYFITKKNKYYRAPFRVIMTGYLITVKNNNHPATYKAKKRLRKALKKININKKAKFTQLLKKKGFQYKRLRRLKKNRLYKKNKHFSLLIQCTYTYKVIKKKVYNNKK